MSGGWTGKETSYAWQRYVDEAIAHLRVCEECWEYVMKHKENLPRQGKL